MKQIFFTTLVFLFFSQKAQSQVAINRDGDNPATSSMLDIESTTKGLLIPRMTESQKNFIPSPSTGLLVFQTDSTATDDDGYYYYNGSNWVNLTTGSLTTGLIGRTTVSLSTGDINTPLTVPPGGTLPMGAPKVISDEYVNSYIEKVYVSYSCNGGGVCPTTSISAILVNVGFSVIGTASLSTLTLVDAGRGIYRGELTLPAGGYEIKNTDYAFMIAIDNGSASSININGISYEIIINTP